MRMCCVNGSDRMLFVGVSLLTMMLLWAVNLSPNQVGSCGFQACALSLKFPCSAFLSGVRFLPIIVCVHGEDRCHLAFGVLPSLLIIFCVYFCAFFHIRVYPNFSFNAQLEVTGKRSPAEIQPLHTPFQF